VDSIDFINYTTQKGQGLLRGRHTPPDHVATKWNLILPPNFSFNWQEVWDPKRARKEAYLLWQLWHKANPVNIWRGCISHAVNLGYPMCLIGVEESVMHRFWSCDTSQQLWLFTTRLLNHLASPTAPLTWTMPDWRQTLFA
jgi:hypothetical protein